MKVYYDSDADPSIIAQKRVAVIGFGSQGHAHAGNLQDSGVDVVVGLRPGSSSRAKADRAGIATADVGDAVASADIVMILVPDELQANLYQTEVAPNLKAGAAVAFAHGFNIHFQFIQPAEDIDTFMVAPKGPGHLVRSTYVSGGGVPCLIAIYQDASGGTQPLALSYASAIGGGRAGVIETTFREETETDLFGEQTVLCGGVTALVEAGFDTLVDAGYAPEMAYFECLHELKLIVDLIYEGGIQNMRYSVSNTAEYGDLTRGPRIVDDGTRAEMRKILSEIQSGDFAREWMSENASGSSRFNSLRKASAGRGIEEVGSSLRAMMPWISAGRLVDRDVN